MNRQKQKRNQERYYYGGVFFFTMPLNIKTESGILF